MKILLALDGSQASTRALTSLIEHVKWFRDPPHVHLLFVHLPIPIAFATRHVSQEIVDGYYRDEGEAVLAPARERLMAAGIGCTSHLHVGEPAEIIVKVARELDCELISMGTHGRGAFANAVVGSVASKVLHLSDRPVLFGR